MAGVYRGAKIFACLPNTRTLGWSADSVLFKFSKTTALLEKRIAADRDLRRTGVGALGWTSFELKSHERLPKLLRWLARAYESAR